MEDLKSCPCCKSDYVERERDSHVFAGQTYSDRYPAKVATQSHGFRVRCGGCGIQTCWWHYENEADEAWNNRTDSDEVRHLKESIQVIGFMLAQEKVEVARLRDTEKDKARLDWMIFNSAAMYHSRDGDVCFIRWPDDEDGYWQTKPHGNNRETIDAAISGEKFHTERPLLNSKGPADCEP